ncbi:MAG TPA: hypothetical protein VIL35_02425 [Vicinamibacterales bacterium]
MKRAVWLAAAILAAAAAFWWWTSERPEEGTIDLVEAFRAAEKRSNVDVMLAFSIEPQTVNGETKRAIYMHPTSRVVYRNLLLPERAQLHAFLALKDEVYQHATDGVYFRIGVAKDGQFTDLLKRHLDPHRNQADRGWVPVTVDLSAYAGQTVDLILNTNSSPPGMGDNSMYDFAVIGEPTIRPGPPQS